MKKLILGVLFLIFTFSACHKETVNQPEAVTDYLPLQIGNYWIYRTYRVDTLGQETIVRQKDSIFISNDTIINSKTYSVFKKKSGNNPSQIYRILRDSSNYLVDNYGHIFFSTVNFSNTLLTNVHIKFGDTSLVVKYKMIKPHQAVTVDAGTFNHLLNFQGDADIYVFGHIHRTINNYYTKDVGLVLRNWYFVSSPDNYKVRLVRYHLQ